MELCGRNRHIFGMAITRHLAELILTEHRFRKISGRVLLLGRQTVFMTPEEVQALVLKVGLEVRPTARIDHCTMPHGKRNGYIADASFFSLFTDAVVEACDVTDYEGAEHIFDLSRELPGHLRGAFDFIYNGSVLDNVFDPAACLRNTTRMLKPEATIFHYEGSVHWGTAYLKMSPDWFFDYYALNGFTDIQAYVCAYTDVHASPWDIYEWSAYAMDGAKAMPPGNLSPPKEQLMVTIAQNGPGTSIDRTPIQNVYRPDHTAYREAFDRVAKSARRSFFREAAAASNPEEARRTAPRRSLLKPWRKPPLSAPPGYRRLGVLGVPRAPETWL